MKPVERDDLLTRLDERTSNIWKAVEKIEHHAEEQNGIIRECIGNIAQNTSSRKSTRWVLGIFISTIATALATHIAGLW